MPAKLSFALAVGMVAVMGCGAASGPTLQGIQSTSPKASSIVTSPTASLTPSPLVAPTQSPSASPSPPAALATVPIAWTTYKSPRYAYAVDYPTDWIATPATQDWPPAGFSYPDDPAIDKWALPAGSIWILMFVSSVPLKEGEDAAARIARLDSDNAQVCQLGNRREVTLDGVAARQEDGKCFGADFISQVAAVKGGRFYLVYILSGNPLSETSLATFDHFVASFQFG